jgi:hypothetical protein
MESGPLATTRRPMNPATCSPCATVTPPLPLLGHHLNEVKRHFAVTSNSLALLLCSALRCRSPWPATIEPPPCCPTRPKGVPWHHAPPTPSASQVTAYRSRAPPASPPLEEGPLESVVRQCLHLHRWRPPVRAKAAIVIPRLPSTSCWQPSPTVLRPRQTYFF